MTRSQSLIAELKMEAASTRKMLERVPAERNDWKPHEHSMSLGRLATHVAEIPGWVSTIISSTDLDMAKRPYQPLVAATNDELMAIFNQHLAESVTALEQSTDEDLDQFWTLRRGDHVAFSNPKIGVIRQFAMSHLYHHRGQLSVYMRLLDIPVPGMYGPSYDDRISAAPPATTA